MKFASLAILCMIMASGLVTARFLEANRQPDTCPDLPVLEKCTYTTPYGNEYACTFTQSQILHNGEMSGQGYDDESKLEWTMTGRYNKDTKNFTMVKLQQEIIINVEGSYNESTCQFESTWTNSGGQSGNFTMNWGTGDCNVPMQGAYKVNDNLRFMNFKSYEIHGCDYGYNTHTLATWYMVPQTEWEGIFEKKKTMGADANGDRILYEYKVDPWQVSGTWKDLKWGLSGDIEIPYNAATSQQK